MRLSPLYDKFVHLFFINILLISVTELARTCDDTQRMNVQSTDSQGKAVKRGLIGKMKQTISVVPPALPPHSGGPLPSEDMLAIRTSKYSCATASPLQTDRRIDEDGSSSTWCARLLYLKKKKSPSSVRKKPGFYPWARGC